MSIEDFETDETQLGISPIGMAAVVLLALIGLALFLNPQSTVYDVQIGGIIVLSIALASMSRIQLLQHEGDLIRTLSTGIIGAAVISIICTIAALATFTGSSIQGGNILGNLLVLGLPSVFEELIFRGSLFLVIRRVLGTWPAVGLQDVLFATYHAFRNPNAVYFAVLLAGDFVFMLVFLVSHNLLSSMISHAIVNLRPVLWQIVLNPGSIFGLAAFFLVIYIQRRLL